MRQIKAWFFFQKEKCIYYASNFNLKKTEGVKLVETWIKKQTWLTWNELLYLKKVIKSDVISNAELNTEEISSSKLYSESRNCFSVGGEVIQKNSASD